MTTGVNATATVPGENYAAARPSDRPATSPAPSPRFGRERRRVLAAAAAGAVMSAVLILGVYFGVTTSHRPAPHPTPSSSPISPPPPVDAPALAAVLRADPGIAGPDGAQLETALQQVVTTSAEVRRQASVTVLQLASSGGLNRDYARAATAAVTPFTQLGTPTDMIQDLDPDPAAAGPNAHYVDNCMHDLLDDTTPAAQNSEAEEILEKLPGWAANGGIRPDITAATHQIAITVAAGRQPTDPDEDDNPTSDTTGATTGAATPGS